MTTSLNIQNLTVNAGDTAILKNASLELEEGKVYAIMGPNGSGKSTLANTIMGSPAYTVKAGEIILYGKPITNTAPDERAKQGLFLSFQYPISIPGVTLGNFLRMAYNQTHDKTYSVVDFHRLLKEKMSLLGMDSSFARRYLNEGFSGGEKKRAEILQMLVLDPRIAILDETDSGLDVDALKTVAEGINTLKGPKKTILLITHYNRILKFVTPDRLFIMVNGAIVQQGGKELAHDIEEKGYKHLIHNNAP